MRGSGVQANTPARAFMCRSRVALRCLQRLCHLCESSTGWFLLQIQGVKMKTHQGILLIALGNGQAGPMPGPAGFGLGQAPLSGLPGLDTHRSNVISGK